MATFESRPGDIFEEDVEAIVNTVNCEGVMGKGLALHFKRRYPQNFAEYAAACSEGKVRPGRMLVHQLGNRHTHERLDLGAVQGHLQFGGDDEPVAAASGEVKGPRFIINFPTKDQWRRKSRLKYIDTGLEDLVRVIENEEIRSIAIPALGCDLGGLDWSDVAPRIRESMSRVGNLRVVILEPRHALLAAR